MSSRPSVLRRSTLGGLLALMSQALPAQTGAYSLLDRIEDNWINRNPVPVRPMVLMPSNTDLWAVNAYFSIVNRIDTSLTVVQSFRTLPGPVSIARYQPPAGNDQLLVVCQHVNAVAVHDAVTGDMVNLFKVKAQPGDIVVDQANRRAFVSCTAADQVVEIDLQAAGNPQTVYTLPAKQPTFLSFQGSEVLVAARVSGNGSVVHRKVPPPAVNPDAGAKGIVDTLNPAVATTGLPDHDVFWLDRATATAVPVVKSAGTLLFAHATKPGTTNELWLLNSEANNKNPARQTEHAIQGEVAFNRLSRILVPNLVAGVTPVLPFSINNLDDSDNNPANGIQYNNATAVGTPYSLVFLPSSGYALAAGLLTSNIAVLDPAGNNVYQWTLPAGAMPRQVLVDQTETFVIVWGGDNRVHVYALGTLPPALLASVSLGFDPTPPAIRDGRRVFFDASHSLHNNASCATCHDECKTDMLAWNLSNISELVTPNDGIDNKGPMVTQTLVGIAKAMPFHWRGEQLNGLIDFNAAFTNLLGGTPLAVGPNSDFEKFAAFVLSLTEDANQFQDPNRVLNDAIQPPLSSGSPAASAINGQSIFTNQCAGACHGLPAGTSNDMVADGVVTANPNIHLHRIKVAPFQGMQFKGMQPLTNVTFNPASGITGTEPYTNNGTGLSHTGLINDLEMFLSFFFPTLPQPRVDGVSFLFQFDSGQAPAVHGATLLNQATAVTAVPFIRNYLMAQANPTNRNCDLVVFGLARIGTGLVYSAWVMERPGGQFRRDDNVLQPFSFFTSQIATVAGTWFAFAGVPVGTGRGFAIDFDQDQLPNLLECATIPGSQFNVDSDGDGFWDGHEFRNGSNWCSAGSVPVDTTGPQLTPAAPAFQWVSGKTARITFETDELSMCTVVLTPTNPVLPTVTLTSSAPGLQHNLLASTLFMGTTYNVSLIAKDLVSNLTTATLPQITTIGSGDIAGVMSNLAWSTPPSGGGGTWSFVATARAAIKVNGAPPPPVAGVMVVARAMINGIPASASQYLAGSTPGFSVQNTSVPPPPPVPYTFLAGPFVISPVPSNGLGDVTLSFTLGSLATGDKVDLVIESVGLQDQSVASPPTMFNNLPGGGAASTLPIDFSLPDTPAPFRVIQFVIP